MYLLYLKVPRKFMIDNSDVACVLILSIPISILFVFQILKGSNFENVISILRELSHLIKHFKNLYVSHLSILP